MIVERENETYASDNIAFQRKDIYHYSKGKTTLNLTTSGIFPFWQTKESNALQRSNSSGSSSGSSGSNSSGSSSGVVEVVVV